jgi:hypothetical protein
MAALSDPFGVMVDLHPRCPMPACLPGAPPGAASVGAARPDRLGGRPTRGLRGVVAGALARAGAPWRSARDQAAALVAFAAGPLPGAWDGDAEVCGCSGRMRYGTCGAEAVCESCGRVDAGDDSAADDAPRPPTGPLRIVGRGARALQPDLYSSAPGASSDVQFGSILDELRSLNAAHVAAGGRDFGEEALAATASIFGGALREQPFRNDARKRVLSACVRIGCLRVGFAPDDDAIARFSQLPGRGIARGENCLRALAAEGKLPEFHADADAGSAPAAFVATFFARLGLGGADAAPVRDATAAIVAAAERHRIGCESLLRAKVEGAAFAAIRRAPGLMLVGATSGVIPGGSASADLRRFCAASGVRLNTIERFVVAIAAHHSRFAKIYRKHGLNADAALQ